MGLRIDFEKCDCANTQFIKFSNFLNKNKLSGTEGWISVHDIKKKRFHNHKSFEILKNFKTFVIIKQARSFKQTN